MKRVTIAGGGLAGLSLGIALQSRNVPVRVIEAANYPRHRVCGEFISGIADSELTALGIHDLFSSAKRHTGTVWYDGERRMWARNLPVPAYGISRFQLDAALAERLQALGGELRCGERFEGTGEGVVVAIGRRRQASEWLGLKAHFENLALDADLEIHLDQRGYVGLTRVEGDRVNVCGLFRRGEILTGENALASAIRTAGFRSLSEKIGQAKMIEGTLKGVSHFSLGWQRETNDGTVSIGDSSAMIPPFTGNGMTMAFQSALAATEPLESWSAGKSDWQITCEEIRRVHRSLFQRRLGWARFLQSVLLNPIGRRIASELIASGIVRFDSVYRMVR